MFRPQVGECYAHYNGKFGETYRVIGFSTLTSARTKELIELVNYEALYDNPVSRFWSRPLVEWMEIVHEDGFCAPRYRRVD